MINHNRLGYEIKRDLTNFCTKISYSLKWTQQKFIHQMLYGILTGNKVHLSEIAHSLKEYITLKKPLTGYPEISILLRKSSPLCTTILPL